MSKFPALILHQKKINAVKRFHPWVFSGAVKKKDNNVKEGDIVEVFSEGGEFLATGHYGTGSIAVRIFSYERINNLQEVWLKKFASALELRKTIGLADAPETNAYRLINAEGDGMPGLIIDWYNGTAVIQCHSIGMNNEKNNFTEALRDIYGSKLKAVYDKSAATLHKTQNSKPETQNPEQETQSSANGYLYGSASERTVMENGHQFIVDWAEGQKTGFFIDQRDNRQLLSHYSKDKNVLNTFCYSGGFSVYALKAGAALVHSVDSSAKAIEWTNENVELNQVSGPRHESFTSDVFDFLKAAGSDYDVIVLDPPAFAKGQSARHSAIQAYSRLNLAAFKKIKPGGIVFTFSCSQAVGPEMFHGAVASAAIDSGRNIRILDHLSQPADHPVSIFHPEGLYLKGLVLRVD